MFRYPLSLVFLITMSLHAQDGQDSASIDSLTRDYLFNITSEDAEERILDSYSESSDATQISEELDYFKQNPVDINTASQNELEQIPGLSPILAKAISDYRKHAVFMSERDLLKIPHFTREVFVQIKDFITVNPLVRAKRYEVDYRQRAKRNIEESRNFQDEKYDGSIYQFYERINAGYQPFLKRPQAQIRAGAVFEKDPGEKRLNDHQVGFVELQDFPFIRKSVIGNYQLEFGQAVSMWSSSGMSKSSEAVGSVKKKARGISAYNYATENAGYYGAAAQFDLRGIEILKNIDVTGFYSYSKLDASFDSDGSVNSIIIDGLHRDSGEVSKKNYLLETVEGANVAYHFGASKIAVTFYGQQFDRRFITRDSVRSLYNFAGSNNNVISLHHDVYVGNINFFGETAKDKRDHFAWNSGIQGYWPKAEWVIFYRSYSKDFQSLHSYAFGEQNGKTQNEEGIYLGLKVRPKRGTTIQLYYDIFRYPWRSYDVPKPVTGDDFLAKAEQRVGSRIVAQIQFKNERKDRSVKTLDILGRDITVVEKEIVTRMRYQWDVDISREVRLRSRVEKAWYEIENISDSKETGILFYEDIRVILRKGLTVYGRLSFFDTHSFNTAIYEYENDVDGVFANTAFSGKGKRWYVLLKYAVKKNINVGVKYWELYRDDLEQIGSGGDAIHGNILRKVTMSMDLSF